MAPHTDEVQRILADAKDLASRYRLLTDKPLGVTGEVAEFEAARLLGLELLDARQPGADARDADGQLYQIKGRALQDGRTDGQMSRLNFTYPWDHCLLVQMSPILDALGIWKAPRAALEEACDRPGSKARNRRRQLSIAAFKRLAVQVWPIDEADPRPETAK